MERHESVCRALLTPLTFLERSARVYPNKVGVVYGETRLTYGQFAELVYRFASALRVMAMTRRLKWWEKPGE